MLNKSGSFSIERRADVRFVGILDFGAVDGSVPSVGRVLAPSGCCVLNLWRVEQTYPDMDIATVRLT